MREQRQTRPCIIPERDVGKRCHFPGLVCLSSTSVALFGWGVCIVIINNPLQVLASVGFCSVIALKALSLTWDQVCHHC